MRRFIMTVLLGMAVMFTGCDQTPAAPSAEKQIAQKTQQLQKQALNAVGMPNIVNFNELRIAKDIYELRDRADLITYTYTKNITGGYDYIGMSIGYGLPYSVQITNPKKMGSVDGGQYSARNPYVIDQPDPNGLFMPSGLSATWILLIDPKDQQPKPVYMEETITVRPFKMPKRLVNPKTMPADY